MVNLKVFTEMFKKYFKYFHFSQLFSLIFDSYFVDTRISTNCHLQTSAPALLLLSNITQVRS